VRAARSAGMSEIATGILHNVGNVLNSVNVAASMIVDRLKQSKAVRLSKVAELIEEKGDSLGDFITNNPKGKHLGPYICELAGSMSREQADVLSEVESLTEGIEHIRQLVASQQKLARGSELREATRLESQVEAALAISSQALGDNVAEVPILREFEDVGMVHLDKHKLLEVLVNVIKNAREAIAESRRADGSIRVRIERSSPSEIAIAISDNGIGIEPEALGSLFSHGYTTKERGNGFGLHACANAAVELGGQLTATSPGAGQGSTFILTLSTGADATVTEEQQPATAAA